MIYVSIWKHPKKDGMPPDEEKILSPAVALHDELVSRLFWHTRVEELLEDRILINSAEADGQPVETVLFQDLEHDDGLEMLERVAKLWAEATGQASPDVMKSVGK